MATKPRAILAGVTISLGPIAFTCDLVPAVRSKASRSRSRPTLTSICPTCAEPNPLHQSFFCSKGHGPYSGGDAEKAMPVDGVLKRVVKDEVAQAKEPEIDCRTVSLSVVEAASLESASLPSGNILALRILKPSAATAQAYALLRTLCADESLGFIAELVLKGATKMYRLISWQDMLVLTELVRPGEFYAPDVPDGDCDEQMISFGKQMVASLSHTFEARTWQDHAEARLVALRATLTDDAAEPEEHRAVAATTEELLALLQEAVPA